MESRANEIQYCRDIENIGADEVKIFMPEKQDNWWMSLNQIFQATLSSALSMSNLPTQHTERVVIIRSMSIYEASWASYTTHLGIQQQSCHIMKIDALVREIRHPSNRIGNIQPVCLLHTGTHLIIDCTATCLTQLFANISEIPYTTPLEWCALKWMPTDNVQQTNLEPKICFSTRVMQIAVPVKILKSTIYNWTVQLRRIKCIGSDSSCLCSHASQGIFTTTARRQNLRPFARSRQRSSPSAALDKISAVTKPRFSVNFTTSNRVTELFRLAPEYAELVNCNSLNDWGLIPGILSLLPIPGWGVEVWSYSVEMSDAYVPDDHATRDLQKEVESALSLLRKLSGLEKSHDVGKSQRLPVQELAQAAGLAFFEAKKVGFVITGVSGKGFLIKKVMPLALACVWHASGMHMNIISKSSSRCIICEQCNNPL